MGESQYQEGKDCSCGLGKTGLAKSTSENELGVQLIMGFVSFGEDTIHVSLIFGAVQNQHPVIFLTVLCTCFLSWNCSSAMKDDVKRGHENASVVKACRFTQCFFIFSDSMMYTI